MEIIIYWPHISSMPFTFPYMSERSEPNPTFLTIYPTFPSFMLFHNSVSIGLPLSSRFWGHSVGSSSSVQVFFSSTSHLISIHLHPQQFKALGSSNINSPQIMHQPSKPFSFLHKGSIDITWPVDLIDFQPLLSIEMRSIFNYPEFGTQFLH